MSAAIHPCSFVDFPGRVAAVVFTQGCDLRCRYCHNPDLCRCGGAPGGDRRRELMELLARRRKRLGGVVVSGGEPTLHPELAGLLRAIRGPGFAVKLDTNGMRPDAVEALAAEGLLDFAAVDVKMAPGSSSLALCGAEGQGRRSIETLRRLARHGVPSEARTTVVRDLHDPGALRAIAQAIVATGTAAWHLQPVRSGRNLDPFAALLPPPADALADAASAARMLGLLVSVRPSLARLSEDAHPGQRHPKEL